MRKIKLVGVFLLLMTNLNAQYFEKNCLNCHIQEQQLKMFISRYTLKYSSEKRVKNAIFEYLKNPSSDKSVMPVGFLSRFGIKNRSELQDDDLKQSIQEYYNRYNLSNMIE